VGEDDGDQHDVLSDEAELTEAAAKRARIMASVGRVTRTRSVYVVEERSRESIEGTAIVDREEAESVDDPDEFRDLIRERSEIEIA
jgi:putative transcriptional regulator